MWAPRPPYIASDLKQLYPELWVQKPSQPGNSRPRRRASSDPCCVGSSLVRYLFGLLPCCSWLLPGGSIRLQLPCKLSEGKRLGFIASPIRNATSSFLSPRSRPNYSMQSSPPRMHASTITMGLIGTRYKSPPPTISKASACVAPPPSLSSL